MSEVFSEVGFLVFCSTASVSAMTLLLNLFTANTGFNISQDFSSHKFQGKEYVSVPS